MIKVSSDRHKRLISGDVSVTGLSYSHGYPPSWRIAGNARPIYNHSRTPPDLSYPDIHEAARSALSVARAGAITRGLNTENELNEMLRLKSNCRNCLVRDAYSAEIGAIVERTARIQFAVGHRDCPTSSNVKSNDVS
jgi:hypothetical protein